MMLTVLEAPETHTLPIAWPGDGRGAVEVIPYQDDVVHPWALSNQHHRHKQGRIASLSSLSPSHQEVLQACWSVEEGEVLGGNEVREERVPEFLPDVCGATSTSSRNHRLSSLPRCCFSSRGTLPRQLP